MKSKKLLSERDFIQHLAKKFPNSHPSVKLGIGDDTAAVSQSSDKTSLITVDTLVCGVHFTDIASDYFKIGRKCLLVNLSDIAAMGGAPRYFLLSVVIPASIEPAKLDDLLDGMAAEAKENQLEIGRASCRERV